MSLEADDINYLVYRYLMESGFDHAAFIFTYEANVKHQSNKDKNVEPGALIELIHQGQILEKVLSDDKCKANSDGDTLFFMEALNLGIEEIQKRKKEARGENNTSTSKAQFGTVPVEPGLNQDRDGDGGKDRDEEMEIEMKMDNEPVAGPSLTQSVLFSDLHLSDSSDEL